MRTVLKTQIKVDGPQRCARHCTDDEGGAISSGACEDVRSRKLRMQLTHRKLLQSKSIAAANDLRARLGEEVLRRNMSWDGDRSDLSRAFKTRRANRAWPNCA